MKSYNEMAENALNRIKERKKESNKKNKLILKITVPVLSLCLIFAIALAVNIGTIFKDDKALTAENAKDNTSTYDEILPNSESSENIPINSTSSKKEDSSKKSASSKSALNFKGETSSKSGENDKLGFIIADGKTYTQVQNVNTEKYTPKDFLGMAKDFDGFYKNGEINGKVYTVEENLNLLIICLDNGGKVLLEAEN